MNTLATNRLDQIAETVNTEHAQLENAMRESMARAVNIGGLLIEAKQLVSHGEWGSWLADHCTFSERTAQNYMRISARYPELAKSATVADLTYREAIGLLAEPSQLKTSEPHAAGWMDKLEQANRQAVVIKTLAPELINPAPIDENLSPARRMLAVSQNIVRYEEFDELITAYCDLMREAMQEARKWEHFEELSPALQKKVNDWIAWAESGMEIWEYQPIQAGVS